MTADDARRLIRQLKLNREQNRLGSLGPGRIPTAASLPRAAAVPPTFTDCQTRVTELTVSQSRSSQSHSLTVTELTVSQSPSPQSDSHRAHSLTVSELTVSQSPSSQSLSSQSLSSQSHSLQAHSLTVSQSPSSQTGPIGELRRLRRDAPHSSGKFAERCSLQVL